MPDNAEAKTTAELVAENERLTRERTEVARIGGRWMRSARKLADLADALAEMWLKRNEELRAENARLCGELEAANKHVEIVCDARDDIHKMHVEALAENEAIGCLSVDDLRRTLAWALGRMTEASIHGCHHCDEPRLHQGAPCWWCGGAQRELRARDVTAAVRAALGEKGGA